MRPQLPHRAQAMPGSPIRQLAPLADEALRRGLRVLQLNIGQPDLETPAEIRDRMRSVDDTCLAYTPAAGVPEFLETMSAYYASVGLEVPAPQILATTGGSEALLFAMIGCAEPGEAAMVVEPFYTNYRSFATMAGLDLVPVTSRGRDGFHLPPRHVWERQWTDRCRMVVLCNPSNPTGAVYTADELSMLSEFCRERGLFLVSDEVYREFVYDDREAISALALAGMEEHVVVVDSLSKRYSACGIRLGCLVTRNAELYEATLRMAQGRLAAPGLAQLLAVGLQNLGPDYTSRVREEYQQRRDILFDGLTGIEGVFLRRPEGAFYLMARLPVDDASDFARWLLTEFERDGATVMISPGAGFYATAHLGSNEVRLAYVLNQERLREAVTILAEAIPAYRQARGLRSPMASEESEELRSSV